MDERIDTLDHERYDVSARRGFLPDTAPLASLPADAASSLRQLDAVAETLPESLADGSLRATVADLAVPPDAAFDDLGERALRRAYTAAGFVANAYVHAGDESADALPAGVAVPLYESATRLDRTPVLSYDGYVLYNWTAGDADGEIPPGDVRTHLGFTDLRDEEWFVAVHVAIEAAAGPGLVAVGRGQQAVIEDDAASATRALETMAESLADVVAFHDRMPEHNDPESYARGFRPYLGAIDGVVYEGVPALDGPQTFRGASAAQSSPLPAFDAALGVDHGDNPLVGRLRALRTDMPPSHRAFVAAAEDAPDLRGFVARRDDDALRDAYNDCVDRLVALREHHVEVVRRYLGGEADTGTAGIPYGQFLDSFVDDTRKARL